MDNPYSGIADNFAKGQQQAQQYVTNAAELDIRRQTAEHQKAQLDYTMKQAKIEQGRWAWGEVSKLANEEPGPSKNLAIKYFRQGMVQMGMPDPEMLSEMLRDPAQMAQLSQAAQLLDDPHLSPEERENIFEKLNDPKSGLPSKTFNETLKANTAHLQQIIRQREAEKEQRITKATKDPADQGNKDRAYFAEERNRLRTTPEFKEYTVVSEATRSLFRGMEQRGPFRDLEAIYSFMKMLDPNSVVRESEGQLVINTGSTFQNVAKMFQKRWNGKTFLASERRELVNIAQGRLSSQIQRFQAVAQPVMQEAEDAGQDVNKINPAAALIKRDTQFFQEIAKSQKSLDDAESKTNKKTSQVDVVKKYGAKKYGMVKRAAAMGKTKKQYEEDLGIVIPEDLAESAGLK